MVGWWLTVHSTSLGITMISVKTTSARPLSWLLKGHPQQILQRCSSSSTKSKSKVVSSIDEALDGVQSGFTLLSGGFGISGLPEMLINGLLSKAHISNITAVSNNAGIDKRGLSNLLETGQISKMISSFIGNNKTFERLYLNGSIELELCPQGSIAERCRAGASGIPAYYTATGVGTWIEEGKIPTKYDLEDNSKVLKTGDPREARVFDGKKYILERAIYGDVAFVKAYKADTLGNCWFRGSARNFNQVFGKNAKLTIVEAEHIVEPGEIKPEDVHLPSIYVDRIIQSNSPKDIELLTTLQQDGEESSSSQLSKSRVKIVKRASREFQDGQYVNLGIGMPTLAPNYLPDDIVVHLQSENGILGMGPYPLKGQQDPDLINAGKETVTLNLGASLFGSEESFAMIRGGKISLTMLGALQVSQFGDLANWGLPGRIKGMGGAMDLISNPEKTKVVVLMEHSDKKGRSKIVETCQFPLTGSRCVNRIITELGVFDVVPEKGLRLVEVFEDSSIEEIKGKTSAAFEVSEDLIYIPVE